VVVKDLATKNAADLEGITHGLATEVVAAAKGGPEESVLEKVEDAAEVVGSEIAAASKGAIEAVEKHPELLAEFVLPGLPHFAIFGN
jgi:hypothetical protein